MSDQGDLFASSTQPEGNNYSNGEGDFEKLEFEQQQSGHGNQEQEITSTGYAGEEAEEDRYFGSGTSEAEPAPTIATENLLMFDDEQSSESHANDKEIPDPILPQQLGGLYSGGNMKADAAQFDPNPKISFSSADHHSEESKDINEFMSSSGDHTTPNNTHPFTDATSKNSVFHEPAKASGGSVTVSQPCCSVMKNIDPRVLDLIYWRDIKKTGVVFGTMMFMFLSLVFFSVLSVVSYLSLAVLTITLSFRVYKNILQAVQKTGEQHPFKHYLDLDLEMPDDKVQKAVQNVLKHCNNTTKELRRLFLVEDLVDSIKFGLLLWLLTCVGGWFNGMTLFIMAVVTIFTVPKFYETYKTPIDSYMNLAMTHIKNVWETVQAKVPFLKKKAKTQ